jgi:MFS family permease
VTSRRYSKDPEIERSLKASLRDGVSYSVMTGAGEIYFSAYALALKASTPQIAFLAAVPPLLGSFTQLFSAWLGSRGVRRRPIILGGVALQALSWLPIICLPLLFPRHAAELLILSVVLYFAAANFTGPQWSSLMGDLVPERRRGRYFAHRTRLMSLTSFIALVSAGALLHLGQQLGRAYWGFVAVFSIALLARLFSLYQLTRMVEPAQTAATLAPVFTRDLLARVRRSHFARFSMFFACMSAAVFVAAPFFTVYMLRDLQFSYLEYTASTAVSVLAQFLALNLWGRISDAFGNRVIMAVTGLVIPVLPLLWLVSTNFWYILAIQAFGGLSWAGFSLSAGNFLYDAVAPQRRSQYVALHTVLASIGLFFGALAGGLLAPNLPRSTEIAGITIDWVSNLYWIFLLSALARALVALVFIPRLKEVRTVRRFPFPSLIFRVSQFRAVSGLVFSLFPFGQGRRAKPRAAGEEVVR